jgi:hypothetical protein
MYVDSMLHFEVYTGSYGVGGLSDRRNKPFNRRSDLIDPTGLLDLLNNDFPKVPEQV